MAINHTKLLLIKIKKIGPPTPLTHTLPTTILKKSVLSHQPCLHVFEPTKLLPSSFLFQHKQMYKHTVTRFKNVQNFQLLPPPAFDAPAATFRRGTYIFAYASTLVILLFSTSFEISVIITHFLVTPYSWKSLSQACVQRTWCLCPSNGTCDNLQVLLSDYPSFKFHSQFFASVCFFPTTCALVGCCAPPSFKFSKQILCFGFLQKKNVMFWFCVTERQLTLRNVE
jgi:hypothetical protein